MYIIAVIRMLWRKLVRIYIQGYFVYVIVIIITYIIIMTVSH